MTEGGQINVLLVDDSSVVRGLLTRILEEDPEISIVASRYNGEAAIVATKRYKPDIVVLDIEMPIMDGITALPHIMEAHPDTKVLICSTLSHKNADVSLKALELGASECILKPSTSRDISEQQSFRRELVNLVRTITGHRPRDFDREQIPPPAKDAEPVKSKPQEIVKKPLPKEKEVFLRKVTAINPTGYGAVGIGSSTGGPQALFKVLKKCQGIDVPVFITQHMPPTFTQILAQHIEINTKLKCHEAANGLIAKKGEVYVAAGGYHMVLKKVDGGEVEINLDDGPPENYCKPSVDPMFRSMVEIYGSRFIPAILTGMGQDGFASCEKVADKGGPLIAQDKQTSVVWGMPGAVATSGMCTDVLPVDSIGEKIMSYINVTAPV